MQGKTQKNWRYFLYFGKAKIVNSKGQKMSSTKLKKGDRVRVYTTSRYIRESSPASFSPVTKVQLIKHGK